jgi:putative addiction module killer protein
MLAAIRRLPNGLRSWSRWQAPGLRVPLLHGARQFLHAKGVGDGVLEYKIDFGPGYRVYFGRDGDTIVILLTGGTKKRQQQDIDTAKTYWRDYKLSRRGRR